MAHKKWVVRDVDKETASAISEKFNIDPFVACLLVSRGINDDLSVSNFLSKSFETVSPFNFADMEKAVSVINSAVDNNEKICIYGDYDCDGVTSTALLLSFLKNLGADVFYYIPDRISEGYGINNSAVDEIYNKGANLIVTVDNGISSVDEAEYIYSLGMRLVVTDHHRLGSELPRAEAIVNPHREDNKLTFKDYCGVGVAFKLAQAMYDGGVEDLIEEYIELVTVGTLGDFVPLVHENRAFVRKGLEKINNYPSPPFEAFVNANGFKDYSSGDIVMQLCPRINAMGRMGDAARAVEFLLSADGEDCAYKYEQLCLENSKRQEIEKTILEDVTRILEENPSIAAQRVIVVKGRGYHHGVTGIVASNIVERYNKPTFIISVDEDGIARGSARSTEGFNIFDAISSCSDCLIRFGGHPQAAGVTLEENKINEFIRRINEYALSTFELMPQAELNIDLKISPNYLTLDLAENLSVLEPYGAGNLQAVFGVYKMRLLSVTPLKEGKHIRLELEKKGKVIRVVKFSTPYAEFPYKPGDILDIAVKINKNLFRERLLLSIIAVDVRLSDTDDDKYVSEKNDYELYRQSGKFSPSLYPDREICALIYRALKSNAGWNYSLEDLYFRLQKSVTYGQLMFALKAFSQAGLIKIDGTVTMLKPQGKVSLEDTKILKSLREKNNLG